MFAAPLTAEGPATGTLTLTGTDTVENYQAALRSVTYQNLSDAPSPLMRRFAFRASDDGTTISSPAYRSFNVVAVNDPPAGTDRSVYAVEDQPYTFSSTTFWASDRLDRLSNPIIAVEITTLPSRGTLKLGTETVTAGQMIPVAQLSTLTWTPESGTFGTGYASLTFRLQDNGGTTNGGVDIDPTPNTLTFNVLTAESLIASQLQNDTVGVGNALRAITDSERRVLLSKSVDLQLSTAAELLTLGTTPPTPEPSQGDAIAALAQRIGAIKVTFTTITEQLVDLDDPAVVDALIQASESTTLLFADLLIDSGLEGETFDDTKMLVAALNQPWSLEQQQGPAAIQKLDERSDALLTSKGAIDRLVTRYQNINQPTSSEASIVSRLPVVSQSLARSLTNWTDTRAAVLEAARVSDDVLNQLGTAPRLFVSLEDAGPTRKTLKVRVRSPYDQSYVEIEDRTHRNQDLEIISVPLVHAGGTTETVWTTDFERRTNVRGGDFIVRLYRDATKGRLLGVVSGYYDADSNQGSVETQAPWETLGSSTVVDLPTLGGVAQFLSWRGPLVNVPWMTMSAGAVVSHGAALTIDLSQSAQLVDHVRLKVRSGNPNFVTPVRFYRGSELIGYVDVASGGIAEYSDAGGITSVLLTNSLRPMSQRAKEFLDYYYTADGQFWEIYSIQHGGSGGAAARFFYNNPSIPTEERAAIVTEAMQGVLSYDLSLEQLEVGGTTIVPQVTAPAVGLANSPDLARAAHPDWHQSDDTLRRGPSPGYLALGRFSPNAYGIRRDVNKFSAVRFIGTNGQVVPTNVARHVGGSDVPLEQDYWEIIGNTVILRPGAPEQIVIYLGTPDGQDPSGRNIDVRHIEKMTPDGLLPPDDMMISTQVLAIRNPNVSEWVGDAVTEIRDLGRPVTIGQGNVLLNVWNEGLQGGVVRLITNPDTPQANEVTFSIGGSQVKGVSIRFTVPPDGQLKIRVILPDGRIVDDGKLLKTEGDSDERRIAIRQQDGTYQLKWVSIDSPLPTVSDDPSYDPNFVAWKQGKIAQGKVEFGDPANFDEVFVNYIEEKTTSDLTPLISEQRQITEAGLGGASLSDLDADPELFSDIGTLLSSTPLNHRYFAWHTAQRWYTPGQDSSGIQTEVETTLGRVLAGAAQQLTKLGTVSDTDPALISIVRTLSAITGIRPSRFTNSDGFITVLPTTDGKRTIRFAPEHFQTFFTAAQFGRVFENVNTSMALQDRLGSVQVGSKTDFASDETIQLRFNVPLDYREATLYVIDESAPASTRPLQIDIRNRFFTKVSAANVLSRLGKLNAHARFRMEFIRSNGQIVMVESMSVLLHQVITFPLSTNADPDLASKENEILNKFLRNMPMDLTEEINGTTKKKNWYNFLGSEFHAGQEIHDADFNLDVNDQGERIKAVADGTVTHLQVTTDGVTIVVITHQYQNGGTWDSVAMHMPFQNIVRDDEGHITQVYTVDKDGNIIMTLTKDATELLAAQHYASVGHEGASSDHLHQELHTGGWRSSHSINLYGLLSRDELGIPSKVSMTNDLSNLAVVVFDIELQEWKIDSDHVIADIVTTKNAAGKDRAHIEFFSIGGSNPNQRVAWDARNDYRHWYKYDESQLDKWARDELNRRLIWDGVQFSPEQ